MAIQWGSWSGPTSNQFRVGIDETVSGTKVTNKYYVETEYTSADNQVLTLTGAVTGTVNFYNDGGVILVATRSFTGSRGKSYTSGAKLSGVYNGATPSVSVTSAIPALVPSTPGTPTLTVNTNSRQTFVWAAPSTNNGASIIEYQVQRANNSTFTDGLADTTSDDREHSSTAVIANTTYYWRVRARNSVGYSAWSGALKATTPPDPPAAPTGLAVARSSDTQQNLTWTRNATTAAPYTAIMVERRDTLKTDWSVIATLAATATSYADKSTVASRRYDYRVRAKNGAGNSAYSGTVGISTKPSAPTQPAAVKGASNIVVTWASTTAQASMDRVEVQDNPGGTGWVTLATLTGTPTSYTHTDPSITVTHQYRVRVAALTLGTGSTLLWSDYSTASPVVQLAAPPNAPTITGPINAFEPATGAAILSWRHNPVDSSAQRKYQIQHRLLGAATWTVQAEQVSTTSDAPLSQIDPDALYIAGNVVEWQVRTWGVHANASAYSATGTFALSSTPTATINEPVDIVENPHLTLDWAYYQAESSAQAEWQAELLDVNGQLVETASGSGATSTASFAHSLADGSQWTARVRVRSDVGLWSEWDERPLTVDYPEPAAPVASAAYQADTGSVEVGVDNPDVSALPEYPETVHNMVYRSINGGPFILIADQVPVNGIVIDALPTLAGTNTYRVEAVAATGASASSEVVDLDIAEPGWIFVNYGPNLAQFVRFYGNAKLGGSTQREKALHRFAGRRKRSVFFAPGVDQNVKVSGRLTPDSSTLTEFEEAFAEAGLVCYRDPKGRRMFGALGALQHDHESARLVQVSFDVEEVDHDE